MEKIETILGRIQDVQHWIEECQAETRWPPSVADMRDLDMAFAALDMALRMISRVNERWIQSFQNRESPAKLLEQAHKAGGDCKW